MEEMWATYSRAHILLITFVNKKSQTNGMNIYTYIYKQNNLILLMQISYQMQDFFINLYEAK